MNDNQNQALKYFKAFSLKDIETLSEIYDTDIHLTDWVVDLKTKAQVLEENLKVFRSFPDLEIKVIDILAKDYLVMANIIINLDNKTRLKVVDVLTFNQHGLLTRVSAFKQ